MLAYYLALGANCCFATGSQFFTHFSRLYSARWMNMFKTVSSLVVFILLLAFSKTGWQLSSTPEIGKLLLSGIVGLGIGDLCLLSAFSILGPGRTLIVFSFQPALMALAGYFFFDQGFKIGSLAATLFFIACVVVFAREGKDKQEQHWKRQGIYLAMTGMCLDAVGVIMSRWAFDSASELNYQEATFYRCLGALIFFMILSCFKKIHFISILKQMPLKQKGLALFASLLGTVLALSLIMEAVRLTDSLSNLAALAITGPVIASLLECLWLKQRPSASLLKALGLFLCGMALLFLWK